LSHIPTASPWAWVHSEDEARALAQEAVDLALGRGATYADARLVEVVEERLYAASGREPDWRLEQVVGLGVRVLLKGAWGFGSRVLGSPSQAIEAALAAVEMAEAQVGPGSARLEPLPAASGHFRTPFAQDPFAVPASTKHDLVAGLLEEALATQEVTRAVAGVNAKRQRRCFASSEGSWQVQELLETGGLLQVWAALDGEVQRRSYPNSFHGNTSAAGWEYLDQLRLPGELPRVIDEARALLRAPTMAAGTADLVLGPAMTALQIHESCGHALELDRIFGDEAGFAGTSFIRAEERGRMRYGSEAVTVIADPTTPGARGSFAFDDEGQPARPAVLIEQGIVSDFLSSRETAQRIGRPTTAAMRADGHSFMPLCFSTHVGIQPGEGDLEALLERLGDGYYLDMDRSWSIDERRLNFQFGTEVAWEVRRGRRTRLFRNASYGGVTPEFWGSVEAVGGPETLQVFGLPCGKGEPKQWGFVSHGAAPILVRGVRIGVAG
jgi:TldD protein